MNAIGYIRVSSEQQAESGLSLEAQQEKIKMYCTLHDVELVQVFTEAGKSAKKGRDRPELQKALTATKDAAVEAFIVAKLDRFTRSVLDMYSMLEILQGTNTALVSINESLDTQSAMGRFVITILAAIAQMESELISERTRDALAALKAQGRKTGGCVPYGYSAAADGKLEVLAEEVRIINYIMRMREDGFKFQQIADVLNADGIPTKQNGRQWYAQTVSNVVKKASEKK